MRPRESHIVLRLKTQYETDQFRHKVAQILSLCDRLESPQIRSRTAGEVRFIKDRGGDDQQWAWPNSNPTKREIIPGYRFDQSHLKPLVQCLRSTAMALGHALSAHNEFSKLKSRLISPDGNLGGRGYIQKIPDMRKLYMNCTEALSTLMDTLHDEVYAPHWQAGSQDPDPRERRRVKEIMQDVDTIRDDPEGWAQQEESELDEGSS